MSQSNQTSVDRTVSDITPKQRDAIEELLSKAHDNSAQQGVTSAEIDAVIVEAIQSTDE